MKPIEPESIASIYADKYFNNEFFCLSDAISAAIKEVTVSLNTEKDCRLCANFARRAPLGTECLISHLCTDGSKFKPSEPVHLYGKEG